ncbi:MAG: protein translocase subunit SecD [Bacillota bacterium]|nr:protein translocase subunit SecD [Bacillota bacterium]
MNGKNVAKFASIVIIIAILTYIAYFGQIFGIRIPGANDIVRGIDVDGGIQATLTGVKTDGSAPNGDELDSARQIIVRRLDGKGITDKSVTIDKAKKRIIVEIPNAGNKVTDPNATIRDAIQTAMVRFYEVDNTKRDSAGNPERIGDPFAQGEDITGARYSVDQSGQPAVSLTLGKAAGNRFADITSKIAKDSSKGISIYLDETCVETAGVEETIMSGEAEIHGGGMTASYASNLAATIRAGSLPFKLQTLSVNQISPQLGRNALDVILMAGFLAIILVWIFMLLYYRLPGLLANIALLAHTVLQILFLSWTRLTNLTLPGIAGVILTIGMGVDANIIIFERIKEELRNGKTLRAAIDVGFKRAFTAVLDANMTTLITAIFLWFFGTDTIKGFAYTLGLGVILSFLTAVFISRLLLQSISGLNFAKHHWLYGVKTVAEVKKNG